MVSQGHVSKPDKIACLFDITEAIHSTLELRNSLQKVLDLLAQHLGISRSTITLLNPETSEIHTEVAHGISAKAKTKGRYRLGEGVTGRVIESGRPMAIPQIDQEPLFLDRTGARSRWTNPRSPSCACPSRTARWSSGLSAWTGFWRVHDAG